MLKTAAPKTAAPKTSAARDASHPTVKISSRGAARLKAGHVWVYRSDVLSADGIPPGSLVRVTASVGNFTAPSLLRHIANRDSTACLAPITDVPALIKKRIEDAISYRERYVRDTDAYRLVFSEADFLPGLIADRFNDVMSLQILTQAMDAPSSREAIIATLSEKLRPSSIVERVDPHIRELEQLPPRESQPVAGDKTSTVVTMNGIKFHYEALAGQKTGSFLDQRENYAAAAGYAHGDALDVFCYQGGFALHLAPHCKSVTGVDSSRPALEAAEQNATLNGREIEWIEANAFDLLKDYSSAGRQYDTIVVDPPAFAKTKKNLETALRGYKELNLRAFKMLKPGGILVSCSCSYHVSEAEFLEVVADAARDTHRSIRPEKRASRKTTQSCP
jgi:23S rRNA (cytosine1962-C5)-methyltransferase